MSCYPPAQKRKSDELRSFEMHTTHSIYSFSFLNLAFFSETGQKLLQLFLDTQQFVGATLSLHYLLTLDKIIGLFDFVNLYCVLLRRSCTVGIKNAFLWKQLQQTGLIGAVWVNPNIQAEWKLNKLYSTVTSYNSSSWWLYTHSRSVFCKQWAKVGNYRKTIAVVIVSKINVQGLQYILSLRKRYQITPVTSKQMLYIAKILQ